MQATAVSHGAATIINAIATGKGAGFGIDLETKATVKLNDSGKFTGKIKEAPVENTKLIELCAKKVLEYFGLDYGAEIITESNIPIARGLKSSSTAANAVVLATAGAIARGKHGRIKKIRVVKGVLEQQIFINNQLIVPDLLVNLGVEAAIEAKVTITGAYDDASASFLGGFVVTDNVNRKILRSGDFENLNVLIFVPEEKTYTHEVNVERMKLLSREVNIAWDEALKGNLYTAMTLNGVIYSATTGNSPEIALSALNAGAVGAGLSGTGPAVAAVARDNNIDKIQSAWEQFGGGVITAKVNNEIARVLD